MRLPWVVVLLSFAGVLQAQSPLSSRYQLFGGYSLLSNSINGVSGSQQPLINGYEFAFAIPPWHDLRFKMNFIQYRGTNLGAPEHPYFVLSGGQYGRNFGKESAFVEALAGIGNVNADWGANKTIGDTASFSAILGGGQSDRDLIAAFRERFLWPRRQEAYATVRRGIARGELRKGVDLNLILNSLYGPIYMRFLIRHNNLTPAFVDRLCELVLSGARPSREVRAHAVYGRDH